MLKLETPRGTKARLRGKENAGDRRHVCENLTDTKSIRISRLFPFFLETSECMEGITVDLSCTVSVPVAPLCSLFRIIVAFTLHHRPRKTREIFRPIQH